MELTAEQDAMFRQKCNEIKPGEYGEVVVSFFGEPTNIVRITGKQSAQFRNEVTARPESNSKTDE